jgi:hypothetical protein
MVAGRKSLGKSCGGPKITRKNRFVHFYLPLLLGSRPEKKLGGLTVFAVASGQIVDLQVQTAYN